MKRRTASLAFVLALLGACGPAPRSAQVKAAPALDLQSLDGGHTTLETLRGKVVIVDFWATWCGPCIKEIPEYAEFYRRNQPRGIEVVGIVMDSGSAQEINEFVREYRIPYRQLVGDDKTGEAWGVNQGYPTTFVIDGKGMIRTKVLGSPPDKFEKLQQVVDAALSS